MDRNEIDYYSDVLCVWAWIAQRRLEEAGDEWGDRIHLKHHFINVFGNTADKVGRQWSDRGGYAGFATHVRESAAPYETAPVNVAVWNKIRPRTSATAHLVLKAAKIVKGPEVASKLEFKLREAFFVDAIDIGTTGAVLEIANDTGLDKTDLSSAIETGEAIAELLADYDRAKALGVRGSPSWVMNDGRQILYGNVGYRLISANIEADLKRAADDASWC
jgi:predicted DsbA family dithiol-disulfide isomerase